MVMDRDICALFLSRYFGDMITEEFNMYLMQHYDNTKEAWNIRPPILWLWINEDLHQYLTGSFEDPESKELRQLRESCLDIMHAADGLSLNCRLETNEVLAIYDTVCWIYLSRTNSQENILQEVEEYLPFV